MYKIVNAADGELIGTTEQLFYIRKKESTDCFVPANPRTAQGISYLGTPYNLQGRGGVGADISVIAVQFDGGTFFDETRTALDQTNAAIDDIIVAMLEG